MIYLAQDEEQEAVAEMTRELGLEVLSPVSRDAEAAAAVWPRPGRPSSRRASPPLSPKSWVAAACRGSSPT